MALEARWPLVQHRLDGIEQRCARRAKSVLQCPVGGEQMTIQRTMPGARRTLVQRPDQVPADARQAHRLRRPGLGQRLVAGATRSFVPAPTPAPGCARYFASFAHSPTPSDSMRCATPSINACTCSGRCSSPVLMSTHWQRPAQRVHRRQKLIESVNGLGTLAPRARQFASNAALRRRTLSCARILPKRPDSASPSRSIAASQRAAPYALFAPCASRRAHESNRRAAPHAETPR